MFASAMVINDPLKIETTMREGKDVFYRTVTAVDNDGPYEFLINRDMECYYFLPRTRLHGTFQVVKGDGTDCTAADDVNISNLMSACLFDHIEVFVNGTQVNDLSSHTYPIKAFIETFLTYSQECKNTTLRSCLYDEEPVANVETKGKARKEARYQWIIASKKCQFVTPIHVDFFQSEKCLPPNFDLKIRLYRAPKWFGLTVGGENPTNDTYKVKLTDLKLEMRKILPFGFVQANFLAALKRKPQLLPYPSTRIRTYVVPDNVTSQTFSNIVNGRMPRNIIIGFLNTQAYTGSVQKNPFNFHHFNVNNLSLRINGQSYPSTAFTPDFENGLCMREYRHTIDSIGVSHDNSSVGYTFEQFKGGKTFWCFDLSPDNCNGFHHHQSAYGTVDLDVSFKEALQNPMQTIVYCSYTGGILINEQFEVKVLSNS